MADHLDPVIHQPARLRIMAALAAMECGPRVDFSYLKDRLKLTDGNLGAHLITLEEAGYIDVEKTFVGRRPKTFLRLNDKGRAAFSAYKQALEALLNE
jgi:DNA-binding MarR family transcriptional regulator